MANFDVAVHAWGVHIKPFPAMKQTLFLAALLAVFSGLQAQSAKFGYVNSQDLISLLPEAQRADSLLQAFARDVQAQYAEYRKEYETKLQDFESNRAQLSEFVASSREADLQALARRIKEFEAESQPLLERKRNELFVPVLNRAQELLGQIAAENGYRMIFDSANGSIAWAPEADNVLPLVRKKLGQE
jgi:outer membrane protein